MEQRIHIQHVVLSLEPGGLENGVVNVVNGLDSARFRSSVCCLKLAGEFAMRLKAADVAVHELGWRGGIDVLLPFRLAALFRRTGTNVVHTRNPTAFFYGFLGAKLAATRSIVHSEHGRTFDERRLRFWTQRVFSGYTDALFAVSEQLKRDLVAKVGIPANRIEVLYNGVDLGRYVPAPRDRLRGELGLAPGDFVIGSVGRLVTVKNYPLLLQAARGLEKGNLAVLLVGEGPERGTLEAMAREFGLGARVRFLGHREDIAELLGVMDVFVLPSLSEGMSNTLLEAMASGVAVVASDVGGNPEIINDGIDGLLFENRDEAGLREKLRQMQTTPALRTRIGHAGRERVLRDFSLEAMISRYETLYQSVFSSANRAGPHR